MAKGRGYTELEASFGHRAGWEGLVVQDGRKEEMINRAMMLKKIAGMLVNECQTIPDKMEDLVKRTKNAKDALDKAVEGVGEGMGDLKPLCKEWVNQLGHFRGKAHEEVKNAKAEIAALRQMFMSSEYDEEMRRLREYIDVCERLSALKKEGILDDVADTLLKLTR